MSSDMMMFPDTWEEFEQSYGFNDREQIYTNGSRLIQSFRVKQWLDHVNSSRPTGKWIENDSFTCSECGYRMVVGDGAYNYCPNCGSYNGGEDD